MSSASLFVTHRIAEAQGGLSVGADAHEIVGTLKNAARNATPIAENQTNVLLDIEIDVANAKVLSIVADANCTVKTNSSSSPIDTLTLVANKPLFWDNTMTKSGAVAVEKFLSADVTAMYVTTGAIGDTGVTITVLALK